MNIPPKLFVILLTGIIGLSYSPSQKQKTKKSADLKIINRHPTPLRVGFAALPITPEVPDRWIDKNGDAKYNKKDGDTFIDGNGNGFFDPVWIAGFSHSKPATGIHDDTWARTIVIDDGQTRLAIVVLDAIGFMNDEILDIRKQIPPEAGISYTIICSTHTHEGPDLMGLWGKSLLKSGVHPDYMDYVKRQTVKSVRTAVDNMQPARLEISEDLSGALPLVKDTRDPQVFDSGLRMIKAISQTNEQTLGSVIAWADHAETLWSRNLFISSDFPHYVREGVENGVFNGEQLAEPGIGGISIYVNGAIGGLMTTHKSLAVKDPFSGEKIQKPSYAKTEAQGKQLALLALQAMRQPLEVIDSANISLVTRTIQLPVNNRLFKLAKTIGILKRKNSNWRRTQSELAVFTIGSLSFATIPGEAYPELVNGGIEAPPGQDFNISPVETPPLREMMPGKYKFVLGLANDEIGYIIPKSQWDKKPPYIYHRETAPYGEENSLGPETAPIIHLNLKEMLDELKQ